MIDAAEAAMGDDIERLLAAIIGMRAPTDVAKKARGMAQPALLTDATRRHPSPEFTAKIFAGIGLDRYISAASSLGEMYVAWSADGVTAVRVAAAPAAVEHWYGERFGRRPVPALAGDAVSTAAQEAKRPARDMPIGIMGSLAISIVLYVVVCIVLTGIVPYDKLNVADPIAVLITVRVGEPSLLDGADLDVLELALAARPLGGEGGREGGGGGFLSGKYKRGEQPPEGTRIAQAAERLEEHWQRRATKQNWHVLDIMGSIAEETGKSYAQIALNWLLNTPGITAPITGARSLEQLNDNLGAVDWDLSAEQVQKLAEASMIEDIYPYRFIREAQRV